MVSDAFTEYLDYQHRAGLDGDPAEPETKEKPCCPGHDVMMRTGPAEDDYDVDRDYCDGSCQE